MVKFKKQSIRNLNRTLSYRETNIWKWNELTIKNELRFILRSIEFSIWETLRKILKSSFSFSSVVRRSEAVPYWQKRKQIFVKTIIWSQFYKTLISWFFRFSLLSLNVCRTGKYCLYIKMEKIFVLQSKKLGRIDS